MRPIVTLLTDFGTTDGYVAEMKGVVEDGYRILANHGVHGHQEVPHLHVHVFGGRPLGRMLARPS